MAESMQWQPYWNALPAGRVLPVDPRDSWWEESFGGTVDITARERDARRSLVLAVVQMRVTFQGWMDAQTREALGANETSGYLANEVCLDLIRMIQFLLKCSEANAGTVLYDLVPERAEGRGLDTSPTLERLLPLVTRWEASDRDEPRRRRHGDRVAP